jgi:HEPN domain-containing protein
MSAAPSDRGAEALRWLSFAQEDLRASESSADDTALAPRHRCMLAQQAAEKALKAALIVLDIDPPRTHNLQLLADLLPEGWDVRATSADLARLSL